MLQNRATLKQIRFFLLSELRQIYAENESDSISRMILEHVGYTLPEALLEPNHVPAPTIVAQINDIVADIRTGKPIQYVLGYTWFSDLKIEVNDNVLIPRPETEEMVEHIKKSPPQPLQTIIDLGTGSGCIALALKRCFPDAEVWGVDIHHQALLLAARNSRINNLQVNWKEMDLLNWERTDQEEKFNLVVSNPPYVKHSEGRFMAHNVTGFEPESALFVEDDDPLIFYRAMASFCITHLAEKGEVWTEINEQLGKETAGIFTREGFSSVHILKDIHEKERYIHAGR
jgi:release factor glutamine methyltransferase